MNLRVQNRSPLLIISEQFQVVFKFTRQLKPQLGLCFGVFIGLLGVLYMPVVAAQTDSSNASANVVGTIAAMFLLFPVGEERDQSSTIQLPQKIAIFGLDDDSLKVDLETRMVDLIVNRDEGALIEIVTEYSLVIDMENSSDTTMALRSPTIGNIEAQLSMSVQNREFEKVKALLEQHTIEVNKAIKLTDAEFFAYTPITRAAVNQDLNMLELLMSHGADPNIAGDKSVLPPIGHAVWRHNLDMTRLLLDSGASADFDHNQLGREPLALWAAQIDDLALIKLLIEHGVNPSQEGANGWTPLSEAIRLKNLTMAEFLIDSNDPRVLIAQSNPASFRDQYDGRFFPQTNALHLARHFLEPVNGDKLITLMVNRAKELHSDTAVLLMELQSRRSASELAYAELDTVEAIKQRELGLGSVDVYSLDSTSNADLVNASRTMLVNLHELSVIADEPFSVENRKKAAHIGEIDDAYKKWHDMLDVMQVASKQDATPLIDQWRKEHGDPAESGWNYDMLLSWADEEISDRLDRVRVYETIDVFRVVKVFTTD